MVPCSFPRGPLHRMTSSRRKSRCPGSSPLPIWRSNCSRPAFRWKSFPSIRLSRRFLKGNTKPASSSTKASSRMTNPDCTAWSILAGGGRKLRDCRCLSEGTRSVARWAGKRWRALPRRCARASSTPLIIGKKRSAMLCNLAAISTRNSPINSSACTSTSAPSTTATTAAKPCAACSTWGTRRGSFRSRRGWSGCKKAANCELQAPEARGALPYPLRKRKHRINVHRNIRGRLQRRFQFLRHRAVFLEPVFRARAVSGGFDLQQFLGKISHCARHLCIINRVSAAGIGDNCAALGEIVEFHHLGLTVCLGRSEAHGAKHSAYVGCVIFLQLFFWKRVVIHQPFEREHSGHVGLRFFQAAVARADCFPDIDFSRRSARERRAQPVTNFMHDRALQITLTRNFRRLIRLHQLSGDRQNYVVHARVHEVLEEKFLASLLLMHPRIVRQIVSYWLVAVRQVSRAKRSVHHFHRRLQAMFRRAIFRCERQCVLNFRYIFLE